LRLGERVFKQSHSHKPLRGAPTARQERSISRKGAKILKNKDAKKCKTFLWEDQKLEPYHAWAQKTFSRKVAKILKNKDAKKCKTF